MTQKISALIRTAILILATALPMPWLACKTPGSAGDDPEARPPVTQTDVLVVQRAREILDSAAKWNRADTRVCPPDARIFSLYCALEKATAEVTGKFEHRGAVMQEARFVIDANAPHRRAYHHRLMDYNNDPATTFADVQQFFRQLEDRVTRRLREASGGRGQ
jgi:hypothetical protein